MLLLASPSVMEGGRHYAEIPKQQVSAFSKLSTRSTRSVGSGDSAYIIISSTQLANVVVFGAIIFQMVCMKV